MSIVRFLSWLLYKFEYNATIQVLTNADRSHSNIKIRVYVNPLPEFLFRIKKRIRGYKGPIFLSWFDVYSMSHLAKTKISAHDQLDVWHQMGVSCFELGSSKRYRITSKGCAAKYSRTRNEAVIFKEKMHLDLDKVCKGQLGPDIYEKVLRKIDYFKVKANFEKELVKSLAKKKR